MIFTDDGLGISYGCLQKKGNWNWELPNWRKWMQNAIEWRSRVRGKRINSLHFFWEILFEPIYLISTPTLKTYLINFKFVLKINKKNLKTTRTCICSSQPYRGNIEGGFHASQQSTTPLCFWAKTTEPSTNSSSAEPCSMPMTTPKGNGGSYFFSQGYDKRET